MRTFRVEGREAAREAESGADAEAEAETGRAMDADAGGGAMSSADSPGAGTTPSSKCARCSDPRGAAPEGEEGEEGDATMGDATMGAAEDEVRGCCRVPRVPRRLGAVPGADGAADHGRSSGGRGRATRTSEGGRMDFTGGAPSGRR